MISKQERLTREQIIWIGTTQADGRPHLVPIWFAWHDQKVYIGVQSQSAKAKNMRRTSQAIIALEDGVTPVIAECHARLIEKPYPAAVIDIFKNKYNWHLETDSDYNSLFELTPYNWLMDG